MNLIVHNVSEVLKHFREQHKWAAVALAVGTGFGSGIRELKGATSTAYLSIQKRNVDLTPEVNVARCGPVCRMWPRKFQR